VVYENEILKTAKRHKLQHKAVVMMLKNYCIQRHNIHVIQYMMSLCLIPQLHSSSAKVNKCVIVITRTTDSRACTSTKAADAAKLIRLNKHRIKKIYTASNYNISVTEYLSRAPSPNHSHNRSLTLTQT